MSDNLLIEVIDITAASESDICSGTLSVSSIKGFAVYISDIVYIYCIAPGGNSGFELLVCCVLMNQIIELSLDIIICYRGICRFIYDALIIAKLYKISVILFSCLTTSASLLPAPQPERAASSIAPATAVQSFLNLNFIIIWFLSRADQRALIIIGFKY